MRILFLTSLYSSPLLPGRGLPNRRIEHVLNRHADVHVIAPLPYYPAALVRNREDLLAQTRVPFAEIDDDGTVLHPRYLHIPHFGRALYPWLYATSIAHVVRREIEAFRPDVILSAWAYPDGVAAVALARLFGLPSVLRVMGSDINAFGLERLRKPQIAWALRNATRVVAVSSALGDACVELVGDAKERNHLDIIRTGVDIDSFHPVPRVEARAELGLPEDKSLIVVPARLSVEKGVSDFVSALASLPNEAVGVLVGEGPEEKHLRDMAAARGIGDRLVFAGQQPEKRMRLFYSAADLVCLPSTEEGWPNALMESFACGCPWVATRVGGIPEMLDIAPGGALAEPSNPLDLAEALRRALDTPWDRDAIAEKASHHSLETTGLAYLESCRAAIAARRTKAPFSAHTV